MDLNGIRTRDLCDTGAVLYQLSYQANWELATLWVRNIRMIEGEEYRQIYDISCIWTAEGDIWRYDWSSQLCTQLKQFWNLSLQKNSGLKGIRTHDLCDTGTVLYQLSYLAKWVRVRA